MPSQTRSGNTSFTPTLASSPVIKSASSAYSSASRLQPLLTVLAALHLCSCLAFRGSIHTKVYRSIYNSVHG